MDNLFRITLCLLLAVPQAMSQQPQASAPPRSPLITQGDARQISAHVWVIEDRFSTPLVPNVGFVVGSKGVLVIDTGMGSRNGAIVLAEAQKVAPSRHIYLVTTHIHPEHDLGAGAFPPDTTMIRSADEERDIAKNGLTLRDKFMSRTDLNKELLDGATFRKADVRFDKEYDLDLGGVSARILAIGPNHTIGDTVIFVPGERVLFSGDVAMRGGPAFVPPDSSLKHWLVALSILDAMQPAIVVPAHGPIGDASYIAHYQLVLTTIRDKTAAAKRQGMGQEQTVAAVLADLGTQYGDPMRLRGVIETAYSETP